MFCAFYEKADTAINILKACILLIIGWIIAVLLLYLLWHWQVFDVKSIKGLFTLLLLWGVLNRLVGNLFVAIKNKGYGAITKSIFGILFLWGIVKFLPAFWSGVVVAILLIVLVVTNKEKKE